jgi:hypothetical protein
LFERYSEKARRVIFFARYEASQFGTEYIETEHLLLGLLREDMQLCAVLRSLNTDGEQIRLEIESQAPTGPRVSTSVDMPLSEDCARILELAAEEADSLADETLETGHLMLGLLCVPGLATTILQQHGITHAMYREVVRQSGVKPPALAPEPPSTGPLSGPIAALNRLLDLEVATLDPEQRLKRKPWTRMEAMGHLVDLATAHHQWLARALTEPVLTTPGYPTEECVTAQSYASYYSWRELVSLWLLINRLLVHVLTVIPEEKLAMSCRIGVAETMPLSSLIRRYVADCEDLLGQIMAKL